MQHPELHAPFLAKTTACCVQLYHPVRPSCCVHEILGLLKWGFSNPCGAARVPGVGSRSKRASRSKNAETFQAKKTASRGTKYLRDSPRGGDDGIRRRRGCLQICFVAKRTSAFQSTFATSFRDTNFLRVTGATARFNIGVRACSTPSRFKASIESMNVSVARASARTLQHAKTTVPAFLVEYLLSIPSHSLVQHY